MDRREFIKHIGGAAVATSVVLSACKSGDEKPQPNLKALWGLLKYNLVRSIRLLISGIQIHAECD